MAIADFAPEDAGTVLGWVRSAEEAEAWASITHLPLHPSIFRRWHLEPGVVPCLGMVDGEPGAYGEVWEDHDEGEAELARILVAPERRGHGVGQRFVGLLVEEARRRGFNEIWVRVAPSNQAALACYRGAGFARTSRAEEATFNEGQPRPYVWMRFGEAAGRA